MAGMFRPHSGYVSGVRARMCAECGYKETDSCRGGGWNIPVIPCIPPPRQVAVKLFVNKNNGAIFGHGDAGGANEVDEGVEIAKFSFGISEFSRRGAQISPRATVAPRSKVDVGPDSPAMSPAGLARRRGRREGGVGARGARRGAHISPRPAPKESRSGARATAQRRYETTRLVAHVIAFDGVF
jgi:hypothetical protein